ncbi:hypothetical protein KDA_71100 [Dictyobacter alpinus]|uniref:Acyltransferase 3 domain-containing protein n=1 Tax=Dictyobacter alpinus TaxID=2014873 RepID=A0A402BJX3_9CHLR|nr:acyltransferase family protein [Dictyobacter alpinus]GCE31626.1 hypothetical protein KDA_71100 [Dictyobacter alpinus]
MSFQLKQPALLENVQTQTESAVTSTPTRLFFVDHVRVTLTILVILHHLAITYGALGPWYYQEPTKDPLSAGILTFFMLINQSFFMGLFFLISAYFTPGSYARKGPRTFLKDRLLRLGIPLLVFSLLINPLLLMFSFKVPFSLNLMGTGPLWFVTALLMFDCLYVIFRQISKGRSMQMFQQTHKPLTFKSVLAFTLFLAVFVFITRLWFPFGWSIPVINLTISNFPQYISLFIVGLLAAHRGWFQNTPSWIGKVGLWKALGSTLILLPLAIISGPAAFTGGLHWQSFVYGLWESIMGVGMASGLLILFRQRHNRQGRIGRWLSQQTYAVYCIHAPMIVCIGILLSSLHLYPLLKFALVSLVALVLCFGCADLLRRIPAVRRIL